MGILDFLFAKKKEEVKLRSSTQQSSIKKEAVDWRTNEAHLLLLSRFLYAQKAKDAVPPHWEAVLGEPPQRTVDRFISEGWLVPSSLPTKLDRTLNTTEIKSLLKEHGLSESGRKDQGIERLVKAAPEEMAAKVANLDIMECSIESRAIAERFIAERKVEREAAEAKSLDQLHHRDFHSVVRTIAYRGKCQGDG